MKSFFTSSKVFIAGASLGIVVGVIGTTVASGMLGSSVFRDVPQGAYFDEAIGNLYSLGIIKGSNGRFAPTDAVSRADLSVILDRLIKKMQSGELGDIVVSSASSRSSLRSVSSSSVSSSSSSKSSSSSSMPSSNVHGFFRFSTQAANTAESAGQLKIIVVRTGGKSGTVSMDYKVLPESTAVAGTDYEPINGTLTFSTNETSKTFSIVLKNNPAAQGHKTLILNLSNITGGGTLSNPTTQTITIQDLQTEGSSSSGGSSSSSSSVNPAGTLSFGATVYTVNETDGSLNVNVMRHGGTTGTVGITYATNNGTATSGTNYTAVNGTLTFNAGETMKSFSIPVTNNPTITGNRAFSVIIGTPTGGASVDIGSAQVTLFDNESGPFGSGSLKFAKESYAVNKSAGKAIVSVLRVGGTRGSASVNYSTTSGTASSGPDFTNTSGTLNFAPGESSKNIVIPIPKNSSADGKTFTVDLSGNSNGVNLMVPYSTTVRIDN